jgi:Uma2 family endonuclease
MGESDVHRRVIIDLIGALETYYAGKQVYVSGDLLLFYEPGNRRRHVSPDVLVTIGLELGDRLNYILWQEGKPPDMVIEVTSKTTRREDLEDKFVIYRDQIKVPEYFLFDPLGDYLRPQLQGYRLRGGEYVPIRPVRGRLVCKGLGLELAAEGKALRLFDQRTGQALLSPRESAEQALEQAEQALQQAELAKEQVELAKERVEQVQEQAEKAKQQAERERLARQRAEGELARLRRELARLQKKK